MTTETRNSRDRFWPRIGVGFLWLCVGLTAGGFEVVVSPHGDDTAPGTPHHPVRTLVEAQTRVRAYLSLSNHAVTVTLRGGTYFLDETLRFTAVDTADGAPVTWRAWPDETVVISGGYAELGWTDDPERPGAWVADVPVAFHSRHLWVDARRAVRARSVGGLPDATFDSIGHTTSWLEMLAWRNPRDIEMVYQELWTNSRCAVDAMTLEHGRVRITMRQPGWFFNRDKGWTSSRNPWYVENALELMDQPGEWYLDRFTDRLHYIPHPGESREGVLAVLAQLETLVSIEGASTDETVRDLHFVNLSFRHSGFLRPAGDRGHPDAQNNIIRERFSTNYPFFHESVGPGAVEARNAVGLRFSGCDFRQLGHIGLLFRDGVRDSVIEGCSFHDISAQAIQLGDGYDRGTIENYYPTDPRTLLFGNRVIGCAIDTIGVEFRSAAAIGAVYPDDLILAHNEIRNTPYSGFHIGYSWDALGGAGQHKTGDYPSEDPPPTRHVRVVSNAFRNIMLELQDGGAVYTLGETRGTDTNRSLVAGNYVENMIGDFAALYFDEGSSWWEAYHNVCVSVPRWLLIWTDTIHDNRGATNYSTTAAFVNLGINTPFDEAIGLEDDPDAWPAAARAIRDNAGLARSHPDRVRKAATPAFLPVPRSVRTALVRGEPVSVSAADILAHALAVPDGWHILAVESPVEGVAAWDEPALRLTLPADAGENTVWRLAVTLTDGTAIQVAALSLRAEPEGVALAVQRDGGTVILTADGIRREDAGLLQWQASDDLKTWSPVGADGMALLSASGGDGDDGVSYRFRPADPELVRTFFRAGWQPGRLY